MGKAPASQFYWNDYYRDTRALSPSARGIWMDCLCVLHWSPTRGQLTQSVEAWCRSCACTEEELRQALIAIRSNGVALLYTRRNGNVTVISRRMLREENEKESTRLRVARYREKRLGNAQSNASVPNCNNALQSSSSSSLRLSPKDSEKETSLAGGKESAVTSNGSRPRRVRKALTDFPEGFTFNDRHAAIASGFGLNVHAEFAAFRNRCEAKGTQYKDWNAGFRTWLDRAITFKEKRS